MQRSRLQQLGFSLLELMIALAIAAILLAMAMPSLQSFAGDSEMSAANNQLVYSLQTARSEAIKRSAAVGLCPSANSLADEPTCGGDYTKGWIVFVDADGNGIRNAADEVVLQSEALSPAFSITADNVFADRIYFNDSGTSTNPAGIPLSGNVRIDYQGGSVKRDVKVAANGRITTQSVQ